MISRIISFTAIIVVSVLSSISVDAQQIELYMNTKTKQLYAEPGPGRIKLGTFVSVEEKAKKDASESLSVKQAGSISQTPAAAIMGAQGAPAPKSDKQWYEKFSVRGYTQFRYTSLLGKDGEAQWFHPADRSVSGNESFLLRRVRFIFSGDISDRVYLYVQPEFNASPSDGDFSTQLRDAYADFALDKEKESRIRLGQSKVPYGFANMQSSQNRITLERAEGINSAAEGERDIGFYYMWAPAQIRERFRHLVNSGLKGSGDYGVFTVGAYNGQGLNRSDQNDQLHTVVRASYPFELPSGQFFEPGIQAYTGRYVPRTNPLTDKATEETFTPTFSNKSGVKDQRVGVSAVLYPQPFGIEAEWNIGRTPELSSDLKTIDDQFLTGGYILTNYKLDTSQGIVFPFVRWQYMDGGRKFAKNSPHVKLNEWDFGFEWAPYKELELTVQYSLTNTRTNTNDFPYGQISDGNRLGLQAQWNY